MLRHRKNHIKDITSKDLEDMDESLFKFDKTFHKLIAPVMPSKGKTMKYHKLSHITSSIRRLGSLREFDAQFYEASNKQQKASYNTTSKKMNGGKYLQEMAGHQEFRQAMYKTSTFDPDSTVINRGSAYLRASKSGENAMAEVTWITLPSATTTPAGLSNKASKLIKSLDDYPKICEAVKAAFEGDTPSLLVRRTAVINAAVPWLAEDNELQTIRAAPEFHGRPYYDSVTYKNENGHIAYGLVRLLFKARRASSNTLQEMVCIQVYDKSQLKDILTKAGCLSLNLTSKYVVVHLECLSQRIYVVPDFQRGASNFHTCKWKWNRTPIQDY